MVLVLPTVDADYENGINLIQRTWVAKYDVEDLNKQLADRYETFSSTTLFRLNESRCIESSRHPGAHYFNFLLDFDVKIGMYE